jgi:hypothetical protein
MRTLLCSVVLFSFFTFQANAQQVPACTPLESAHSELISCLHVLGLGSIGEMESPDEVRVAAPDTCGFQMDNLDAVVARNRLDKNTFGSGASVAAFIARYTQTWLRLKRRIR